MVEEAAEAPPAGMDDMNGVMFGMMLGAHAAGAAAAGAAGPMAQLIDSSVRASEVRVRGDFRAATDSAANDAEEREARLVSAAADSIEVQLSKAVSDIHSNQNTHFGMVQGKLNRLGQAQSEGNSATLQVLGNINGPRGSTSASAPRVTSRGGATAVGPRAR